MYGYLPEATGLIRVFVFIRLYEFPRPRRGFQIIPELLRGRIVGTACKFRSEKAICRSAEEERYRVLVPVLVLSTKPNVSLVLYSTCLSTNKYVSLRDASAKMTEWLCFCYPLHPSLPTEDHHNACIYEEIYGHGSIEKRVDEEDEDKGKRRKVISELARSSLPSLRPLNL